MATNRDLLKEAIADAKAVKETAIANAKAALEEAFTPYLKEKLSAKLTEMEEEEMEEIKSSEVEEMEEMKNEEGMDEEISLDELLAELEEEESSKDEVYEAKKDEEAEEAEEAEMNIEDMSEDDLKSFIEDVIKDMVSAGELEAGESMEGEGEADVETDMEVDMEAEEELDEEFNIDELLAEMEAEKEGDKVEEIEVGGSDAYLTSAEAIIAVLSTLGITGAVALSVEEIRDALKTKGKAFGSWLKDKIGTAKEKTEEQLDELYKELNEVNLLNAKLLYTNKIFRTKSLTESQKIKVLSSFDKATTKKEAQLIYETLIEGLKASIAPKTYIKESLGSASKVLGGATSKPIIENDAFARMRELAFGGKK
jgi:hypothetical protein